jgi:hypothetical protein
MIFVFIEDENFWSDKDAHVKTRFKQGDSNMTRSRWEIRAREALAIGSACLIASSAIALSCDLPAFPNYTLSSHQ